MLRYPFTPNKPYTALALNFTFPRFFDKMWDQAKTRVAADGGVNRIHKYFLEKNINNYKVPDFVGGDFDSVKPDIRKIMESRGSKFIHTENQDYCDVQKTINLIIERKILDPIIVMGGYGGRFDHTAGVLNAALWAEKAPIFLLDNTNIMTWIKPGMKGIEIPPTWTTGKCSLLPLVNPVRNIRTSGLKINLNGPLELGKHISVSNKMTGNSVLIETTDPILFTCQIPEDPFKNRK